MKRKTNSDIVAFLESLGKEIARFLLDYHYPAVAELWESYDCAILELREIAPVLDLMRQHDQTWHDESQGYWLMRLVEEVGELASSMAGHHEDPIDWEVMQIASIALNWLRLFSCNKRMQELLDQRREERT